MKRQSLNLYVITMLGLRLLLAFPNPVYGQDFAFYTMTVAPQSPPTADGVVAHADADEITISTATSDRWIHYKAQASTAYMDESGNPISRDALKEGTPVTVYFERDGESERATRVILRNSIPVETTTTPTEETTLQR